ncbi:MAG: hypothetical protein A2Z51_01005 [Deltaproteobacteria bacterium RBG_19FT_COMBO_52_11]|nr:MAG: hypothetical protein A2Z51_01005 [Deltaproteobacteria bacterium RBG_19FT_COMBO_52_11]
MAKRTPVYVAIMAGGGGTRFWPWSREKRPKQMLPIFSRRSMIRETVERIHPLAPPDNTFIITTRSQAEEIQGEVPAIPKSNILVEPVGRNTAPCLCLAALNIQKLNPEAVMVVLPADHYIANRKGFLQTLRAAAVFAAQHDFLLTLGLRPTAPETGYGYIQKGEFFGQIKGTNVFRTQSFREKPTRQKARSYLRQGNFLWNSGMFIWKVGVFLQAAEKFLPQLYEEMLTIKKTIGTRREKRVLEKVYARCQPISVDYGIMEKAQNVAMIEGQFHWDDVGSWSALWNIRSKDQKGNAYVLEKPNGRGKILAVDSSGCLIRAEKKLIAVLGMKDTVVVEGGDALLVCPRERSQEVRGILEELKKKGWKEYL